MGVLQPGVALDFETVRYIFISFFVLLNKHFGSIITCLGFDFHWKKSTCTIFLQQKERYEVCKSLWLLFLSKFPLKSKPLEALHLKGHFAAQVAGDVWAVRDRSLRLH